MWPFSAENPEMPDYAPEEAGNDLEYWTCWMWVQYHKNIKNNEGEQKAIEVLDKDFAKVSWFANLHDCTWECGWLKYMHENGLEAAGSIVEETACDLEEAVSNLSTGVKDVTETVGNVAKTAKTVTNTKLLIGAGIVAGVVYWNYYA